MKTVTYNSVTKRGFTLVEMVVYVAVIAVIFAVVVNTILSVSSAWGNARVKRNLMQQGGATMERILREIRLADSVNVGGSTLGVHPGILELATIQSPSDETALTRSFLLSSTTLMMSENSVNTPLTSGVDITNLIFYKITNGNISEGVRVMLTVEDGVGRYYQSRNFYGTAVLRRSY